MKKQKVLTLEDGNLIKIRVQQIVDDDGFLKTNWFGIKRFELKPNEEYIELLRDHEHLGAWKLSCLDIPQLPPLLNEEDGSFQRNRSPAMAFMVHGSDGRRFRYLYFRALSDGRFHIGTRTDIGIRYMSNCLSGRQRKENEILKLKRLIRKRRVERKERKTQRLLRGELQRQQDRKAAQQ